MRSDLFSKRLVTWRVCSVDSGSDDRYGPSARFQRGHMRCCVDTEREPREHRDIISGKLMGQVRGLTNSFRRWRTCADHRNGPMVLFKKRTANEQNGRSIVDKAEIYRVSVIKHRENRDASAVQVLDKMPASLKALGGDARSELLSSLNIERFHTVPFAPK
jgi:hypothetical protein